VGERLGEATVARVEVHPEFERYWLHRPNATALPVEATPGTNGRCAAAGTVLQPRWELADPSPADEAALVELCARLAARQPAWGAAVETPTGGRGVLRACLVVALAAGLWTCWRSASRWTLAMVGVAALGVRLAVSPRVLLNGENASYEKLLLAWEARVNALYGAGWGVLNEPAVAVFGPRAEAVWATNLVASSVAVAAIAAVGGLPAALLAGLLPIFLAIAGSEMMHVALLALEACAVAAALATRRGGDGAAWVATVALTVLAVGTRPEALPFAAVPLVASASRSWRWACAAAATAGAVAWRGSTLPRGPTAVSTDGWFQVSFWLEALTPRLEAPAAARAFALFLHGSFVSPALWGLALVGLLLAPWRLRLTLVAWWAATAVPVVGKVWPLLDAVRLQAPSLAPAVILAGLGAGALLRLPRGRVLVGIGLLAAAVPRWWSLDPPQAREAAWLREVVPTLGPVTVSVDARLPRSGEFRQVMESLGPARWSGAGAGELVYRGLSCLHATAACPEPGAPVRTTRLGGPCDVDLRIPRGGLEIGFYRAR
jgi:hypothetical protein